MRPKEGMFFGNLSIWVCNKYILKVICTYGVDVLKRQLLKTIVLIRLCVWNIGGTMECVYMEEGSKII